MGEKQNNMGTVSLVLGIIGVVWGFILPFGIFMCPVLGIIAIVMAVMSRENNSFAKYGKAGLILGIIAFVIGLLLNII